MFANDERTPKSLGAGKTCPYRGTAVMTRRTTVALEIALWFTGTLCAGWGAEAPAGAAIRVQAAAGQSQPKVPAVTRA